MKISVFVCLYTHSRSNEEAYSLKIWYKDAKGVLKNNRSDFFKNRSRLFQIFFSRNVFYGFLYELLFYFTIPFERMHRFL